MRSYPVKENSNVQRLGRSFGTNRQTSLCRRSFGTNRQTDSQTSCYFYIRIEMIYLQIMIINLGCEKHWTYSDPFGTIVGWEPFLWSSSLTNRHTSYYKNISDAYLSLNIRVKLYKGRGYIGVCPCADFQLDVWISANSVSKALAKPSRYKRAEINFLADEKVP